MAPDFQQNRNIPVTAWNSSDAWLLQSIYMVCGENNTGASLRSIIATGDYINHAVFSFDELENGLGKLAAAGYAHLDKEKYFLTDSFFPDLKKAGKVPKSAMKLMTHLEKFLQGKTISASSLPAMISREDYDRACADYQAR